MSSGQQFLYLTTMGWKSGKQHRIEIWFVNYNKRYFIILERLKISHWVQNILPIPKVSFNICNDKF